MAPLSGGAFYWEASMAYVYNPSNKFGYKDTLPEDHPEKVIRGADFDVEFNAIANAIANINAGGGTATDVEWSNVLNKPEPIKDLAAENNSTESLITGGRY